MRDFHQIVWDSAVDEDCRHIVRLAIREDLERSYDLTSVALVPPDAASRAAIVARSPGVVAGLPAARIALDEFDPAIELVVKLDDGAMVMPGMVIAELVGPTRSLLAAERLVLNLLGRLSGIATLARKYVDAIAGTHARLYDTRKTTPGWRRLEKYAVRCGGGRNHRTGLFDAVLIKDNHLAFGASTPLSTGAQQASGFTPGEAVERARAMLARLGAEAPLAALVEVEVDSLDQLEEVFAAGPDIVLLDNMTPEQLAQAVAMRNRAAAAVELEASGGVSLATIRAIALSGVDRISTGAITHSAQWLDIGLDWL